MRIAIFGAGGVGGYFGARLAAAGHDVIFIARGAHLAAMRSEGLRVTSPKGDALLAPVRATDDPASVGPVDVILVAVKTWQLDDAVAAMPPLVGAGTMVVPTQNGVEAADHLAVLGAGHVLKGVARIVAHVAAPGHVEHLGGEPSLLFGEVTDERSERAVRFRDALRAAGVGADIPDSVDAALWHKFVFVVPVGGVGAVARVPIGVLRTVPESRALLEAAMREVEAIARAREIPVPADVVARSFQFVDGLPPDVTASLQRDVELGRPSELDAWTGSVVRLGRASGVATPIHDVLYAALLPLELRARGRLPAT